MLRVWALSSSRSTYRYGAASIMLPLIYSDIPAKSELRLGSAAFCWPAEEHYELRQRKSLPEVRCSA